MEEDKYDKLEQLFRSRLGSKDQTAAAWNTPPTSLMEGALDVVNEDYRKKRKGFWLWTGLGLILIGFMAGLLYSQYAIKALNEEITQLHDQQELLIEKNKYSSLQAETKPLASSSTPQTSNQSTPHNSTTNQFNSLSSQPKLTEGNLLTKKSSPNGSFSNEANIASNYTSNNSSVIFTKSVSPTAKTQPLNPISGANEDDRTPVNQVLQTKPSQLKSIFTVLNYDRQPFVANAIEEMEINDEKQASWTPYIFLGSQLSSYSMKNIGDVTYSKLKDYDNLYVGYHIGSGIDKSLSKRWSLTGNLSFQKVNNSSYYSGSIHYDKEKEVINTNGECMYNMNYDVETPMGTQRRSLNMDMTNVQVNNDEIIQNVTDIEHSMDVLSSSVGIKYALWSHGQFSLNMSTGITANLILGLKEELNTKVYYQTLMLMEKETYNTSLGSVNRFYASLFGGLDLSYQLSDHFSLGLQGSYDQSISSLRKSNVNGSTETHLQNLRSALSLRYNF